MVGVVADRVIVELEAKLGQYNANVLNAQRTFERGMSSMRSNAARTEGAVSSSFRRMGTAFGTYLSAQVLLAGARGFLGYVDAAKQLTAQLKLATSETGNFAIAQRDVRQLALETRTDINATGTLYAKLARSAKDLGIQQETVARVTRSVSESFLISGSSAVEAAQGTRQLIQGFQSGVLRGDEFNSVMELAPRLARLLADSLNVPIGKLRAMAEAGELTSDKLVKALSDKKFTEALDAEFKQLPVTFDQAMVLVSNAAQQTFSAFDQGGQFSQALINFITTGTDGFDDLAKSAEQLGIDISSSMAGLHDAFEPMIEGALSAFAIIGTNAESLSSRISSILGALDTAANIGPNLANLAGRSPIPLGAASLFPHLPTSNLQGRFERGQQERQRKLRLDAEDRAFQKTPLGDSTSFQRWMNEPDRYDVLGNLRHPQAVHFDKAGKKKKGRKGPSAETLAKRAERARLEQEREDAAFRDDLARINEDILAARAALSGAAEAVAAAEIAQLESERKRTNESYKADAVQKHLTETQVAELTEANNRLAAAKIQAVQLREQERVRAAAVEVAQADRQNELDMAQKTADLAETRTAQRDAALRILDIQYDIERAELESVIASRESTKAQKDIAQKRLDILAALQGADRAAVEQQSRSPGQSYLAGLNAQDINDQLEQVQVDGLKALEDQLTSTISKVFELGGAFGKIADQIIADLIRIAIQKMIIGPLAGALFGNGSGLGGLIGGLFGGGVTPGGPASATPRAGGGNVRAGQLYRVNETGIEGFQPAQSGKIIPLGRMHGGGGGGVTVAQTFVLDARYGITTPELLRHVERVAATRAAQAGRAAYDASQRSLPKRFSDLQKLGQ